MHRVHDGKDKGLTEPGESALVRVPGNQVNVASQHFSAWKPPAVLMQFSQDIIQKVKLWNLYETPKQQCSIRSHAVRVRVEGVVVARGIVGALITS